MTLGHNSICHYVKRSFFPVSNVYLTSTWVLITSTNNLFLGLFYLTLLLKKLLASSTATSTFLSNTTQFLVQKFILVFYCCRNKTTHIVA